MNGLRNNERNPVHNPVKSDVFSLGMTMLESLTLRSSQQFYDYSNHSIHFNFIEDCIK